MIECMPSPDWFGLILTGLLFVAWMVTLHRLTKAQDASRSLRHTVENLEGKNAWLRRFLQSTESTNKILAASAEELDRLTNALKRLGLEIEWSAADAVDKARTPMRLHNRRSHADFITNRVGSVPAPSVGLIGHPFQTNTR